MRGEFLMLVLIFFYAYVNIMSALLRIESQLASVESTILSYNQ